MRRIAALAVCCTLALCLGTVLSATVVGGDWISSPLASTRTLALSIASGLERLAATPSFLVATGQADAEAEASVTTDQTDYPPGATVIITGAGFGDNEVVTLQVVHSDGSGEDGRPGHEPWDVTADADGGFTSSWYVDPYDSVGAAFLLTATGTSTANSRSSRPKPTVPTSRRTFATSRAPVRCGSTTPGPG